MLLGTVIAFVCIFKRNVSVSLKRIAACALVFMVPFIIYWIWIFALSPHRQKMDTGDQLTVIFIAISLFSWTYIVFRKKARSLSEN